MVVLGNSYILFTFILYIMNKLTDKQKQTVQVLINELKSWKQSNDITSPTVKNDIRDFIRTLELNKNDEEKLIKYMKFILSVIKHI